MISLSEKSTDPIRTVSDIKSENIAKVTWTLAMKIQGVDGSRLSHLPVQRSFLDYYIYS